MSQETNNPVYKLTTDNLQLYIFNTITRSIFEHWNFAR